MVRSVRTATSEADLHAWRRVHLAVLPDEPVSSAAELASGVRPERRLYLAESGGEIVGSGLAGR